MNKLKAPVFAAALASLALLAACGERDAAQKPTTSATTQPQTALGRTVERAMDEVRAKLATENISLNGDVDININGRRISRHGDDTLPKAEITPQGDLLIAGTPVKIDTRQRELLLKHRASLITVAEAGMDIGVQGADLGMKAASEAFASIFSGNTDQIEKRVDAESEKIEIAALKLCDRLPAMLSTQNELAAALPEFKPYANMEQADIDDCRDNDHNDSQARSQARTATQTEVRQEIRENIRKAVRGAAQGAGVVNDDAQGNTAAEAEAASVETQTNR